jgi:hypothetical protein
LAEEKKCGQLQAPKKPDKKCMIQLDEHQKYLIQKTVHSFFWNLESLPICINLDSRQIARMQLLEDELLEISCSKVNCSNMTLLELQIPRRAVSRKCFARK